jgi:curli biogenesis system outer membrane secretion channel CsgG
MRNLKQNLLLGVLFICLLAPLSGTAKDKEEEAEIVLPENKGNLRYSITVSQFENKANWSGQWDLGNAFTEVLTATLQQCGWFIVLGDQEMRDAAMAEQDFAQSGRVAGGKKAPQMGRMTPAQLLVKGAITHVQGSTTGGGAGINIGGFRLGGSTDRAEINVTFYLVDSETGQVKGSTSVVGKAGRKGLGFGYHGSGLVGGDVEAFKQDNVGKAAENAIAQGVVFIVNQLEEIPWEGTIMLVKDGKIVINRGEREGVQVGQRFEAGSAEELVDEDTGEVLDVEITRVGTLEVNEVKEKIAYCKMVEGDVSKLEKGMTIQPVK